MKSFTLKTSPLALAILLASQTQAGGFDNSSRGFDIIYGNDNVITGSYGQTSVPMKATIQKGAGSTNTVSSGEILDDFNRPQLGLRYNVSESITCAAQYEVPFAAEVAYKDDELAHLNGASSKTAPIATSYDSKSLTVACGYTMPLSTGQLTVFGGPKIQEIAGAFDEDLTPLNAGTADNLTVSLESDPEIGFIAGAAFEIPEIALRVSILYHSQVDHELNGSLSAIIPADNAAIGLTSGTAFNTSATSDTSTPQTVELALQSGIAENTLAFIKLRWSEYGKISELDVTGGNEGITGTDNTLLGGTGDKVTLQQLASLDTDADELINPIVEMFTNDTLDYTFGLGHQFTDRLTAGMSFSGGIKLGSETAPLGADSSSLRLPGETTHTLGLGGEYAVTPKLKLNLGLGYTFIDSYTVETEAGSDGYSKFRAEFSKTEATSMQIGFAYQL